MTEPPIYPTNEGIPRIRDIRHKINLHSGFSTDPIDWDNDNLVREYIPDWLTLQQSKDILHTIDSWKYAKFDAELYVLIPLNWVASPDRHMYRDAKIFGVPLRLSEYIDEPLVACRLRKDNRR
jgi:hypothetical protein